MAIGCKKCGACCKYFALRSLNIGEDETKWVLYHGGEIKKGIIFLPMRCLMLTEDNLCKIYEERPITCRNFPLGFEDFRPEGCKFFENEELLQEA